MPRPLPETPYPAALLKLVENYLVTLDLGADRRAAHLVEAMRYSLLAGGKRIRPVLTLATARSRGADPAAVLPAAAALELIHTYSLIHDDLPAIDDDTLRRGRPTCHVMFGEDIAILAGDGLFAEAFNLLLGRQAGAPEAVLAAAAEVAAATGVQGMVGGQYMDVAGKAADDDDLRTLHALKTGRLIEAAVVCGAGLSGAANVAPYRAFAAEVGLLFQIVDDILDETGDAAELGKSVGKDRAQHKVTYVSRFGMDGAERLAGEATERAHERLSALPGDTSDLASLTAYIRSRRR
ncbi:MAG: polyprenyl synthetase family protein [Actinobacteria bacterium]|nr:polyprenyl synthetase family protein [Actinomycetota bacterium]